MKISRIILSNFQQFRFLDLDLTYPKGHPKEGQPLEKVCLIGMNGTGKTTILEVLNVFLSKDENLIENWFSKENLPNFGIALIRCTEKMETLYAGIGSIPHDVLPQQMLFHYKGSGLRPSKSVFLMNLSQDENSESFISFLKEYRKPRTRSLLNDPFIRSKFLPFEQDSSFDKFFNPYRDFDNRLFIYSPHEFLLNHLLNTEYFPETSLDEALTQYSQFPFKHTITNDNVKDFWNLLIYEVKRREDERNQYEMMPENLEKSKKQLLVEFEALHPDPLEFLNNIWSPILNAAGLYFDYEEAKRPVQLAQNLEAVIKVKATQQPIPFHKLSSGIRHFIFRMGYFASLYFKRDIEAAIALFDEPENSLFPTLLQGLIKTYQDYSQNTQFFFATHSPIIAAQFEPCERVILEFDEEGYATASRAHEGPHAGEGDDPNDILYKDFALQQVMTEKGVEKYARFQELKNLIRNENNQQTKFKLMDEFFWLQQEYNFASAGQEVISALRYEDIGSEDIKPLIVHEPDPEDENKQGS